jgi:nucleolar complex protein 2
MKIKKNKKGGEELKKVKETTNQKKSAVSKMDSDLQSKNLDDFLQDWSGNEENDSEAADEDQSENSDEDSGSDDEDVTSASKQKQYLASLKAKDPEFHKFLEENDEELLNFDESSSDEDGTENDGLDPVHKLPDNLEVASDDSDYDDDDNDQKEGESKAAARPKVTNKMIENWSEKLEKSPSIQMISEVVMAFKAALTNISGEEVQGVYISICQVKLRYKFDKDYPRVFFISQTQII